MHQNNLLIFKYNQPKDTIRYYNIVELTNNNLTLAENDVLYKFKMSNSIPAVSEVKEVVAGC